MNRKQPRLFQAIALACCAIASLALALLLLHTASAQEVNRLPANLPVAGEVIDRFGEEWVFSACAGDVVTLTMQSEKFSGYLELFPPTGRRSLAEAGADGDTATLESVNLKERGEYTVIAGGESRSDSGVYTLTLIYGDAQSQPEAVDGWILPGQSVTSTIRTRFGEEWAFRGCQGDLVDIDMESEEFDAYLELYGPSDRQPMAEDDDGGLRSNALIEQFELDETGTFVIVAGGASRNDAGAYTMALVVEPAEPVGTPDVNPTSTATQRATATRAPTTRPTLRPTRRPTATRTSTRRKRTSAWCRSAVSICAADRA